MEWTKISAIIGTVLLVTALTLKLVGYGKAEAKEDVWLTIDSNEPNDFEFVDSTLTTGDFTLMPTRKYFLEIHIEEEPNFTDSDRVYLYEGEDFNIVIERVEPNESEIIAIEHPMLQEGYTFHIWEPNDITVVSLDFIPTWPDYIELEKTLILCYDFNEPIEYDTMDGKATIDKQEWVITKGTKIYFKD